MTAAAGGAHTVIEDAWIPMPDGRRLAARLWLPAGCAQSPVPAVLEYLPYRKRDGTAQRDESTYPHFANAGIAGVRVDIAGHGESDGLFDDEYSEQELCDGEQVIAWIAAQPWCSGAVGAMGISWGGFNALQLAERRPPALKAVISLASTIDRYHDDIHYKQGCQLSSNIGWASVMLCYASRPPDPALRDDWLTLWRQRLEQLPWLLPVWLQHQRRDAYWQHGSIVESVADYQVPTLIIGGWADLYVNAVSGLLQGAPRVTRGIVGPWIHKYPHFAWPEPRIDFIAEAIAWWRRWLRIGDAHDAEDAAAEALPACRVFVNEATRPARERLREQGFWIEASAWPPESLTDRVLYLDTASQTLCDSPPQTALPVTLHTPLDTGMAAGEVFTLKPDGELAGDQRRDDVGAWRFQTQPLLASLDIVGRVRLRCRIQSDAPLANLIVRLIDIHEDGLAARVSWGVLNLAHRNGSACPEPVPVDEPFDVSLVLDECAYRFRAGHRLAVSLSSSYWPTIHPPPCDARLTLLPGDRTCINLPILENAVPVEVPEPSDRSPLPTYRQVSPGESRRWSEQDHQAGRSAYHVLSDTGFVEVPGHLLQTRHRSRETHRIAWDDPLSATTDTEHEWWSRRGEWQARTRCTTHMHCDATHFHTHATLEAWHGDTCVITREWSDSIARDHS